MADESNKVLCPDCKLELKVSVEALVGDILECQNCGTEVEILSLKPVTIKELVEEK